MQVDISQTGAATIRRLAERSPLHLLVSIIDGDPTADPERLFRKWTQQMLEADGVAELVLDPQGYLWAVLRYTFANLLAALDKKNRKQKEKGRSPEQKAKVKAAHQAIVEAAKNQIVLLNLPLSNGKKLCDCTGAECIKEGGWLTAVGRKVGKRLVGEVLSEKQVAALRK